MKNYYPLITAVLLIALSMLTLVKAYELPLAPEQIIPGGRVKPDSFTQPPTITFLSNTTIFNSSNISLPVQIKVGDSTSAKSKQIDQIYYKGDWQTNTTELYYCLPYSMNGSGPRMYPIEEYFTAINLTSIPEGNHTLTVNVGEIGGYIRYQNNLCYAYSFVINKTSTFEFCIDTNATSDSITPSPVPELSWLAVVPLLLSVFAVVILVRHRKNGDTTSSLNNQL